MRATGLVRATRRMRCRSSTASAATDDGTGRRGPETRVSMTPASGTEETTAGERRDPPRKCRAVGSHATRGLELNYSSVPFDFVVPV